MLILLVFDLVSVLAVLCFFVSCVLVLVCPVFSLTCARGCGFGSDISSQVSCEVSSFVGSLCLLLLLCLCLCVGFLYEFGGLDFLWEELVESWFLLSL